EGKKAYPEEARVAVEETSRRYADFLTAFACEVQSPDDEKLMPTDFYMTSGQQEFPEEARKVAERLATGIKIGGQEKNSSEMFREALFGPWKYEDRQHSLGWDPSTERLHALRATRTKPSDTAGVTAA